MGTKSQRRVALISGLIGTFLGPKALESLQTLLAAVCTF